MNLRGMSAADRDRCREQEDDRYGELFELHRDRLSQEYDGTYKPTFAEVHKLVCEQMDKEKAYADEEWAYDVYVRMTE